VILQIGQTWLRRALALALAHDMKLPRAMPRRLATYRRSPIPIAITKLCCPYTSAGSNPLHTLPTRLERPGVPSAQPYGSFGV